MKPFFSLLKVTFRNYYGISTMKQKYLVEKKELWQPILAVIGIGVGVVTLFAFSLLISEGIYNGGKMLGEPALVLELAFLISALMIFVFDIGTVISTLYFAQDNDLLAALPLKPIQVISAKFSLVMANQYLVQALLLIPPLFVFGRGEGMGLLYIILAVLIFLLFPALPLAPAAVMAIILMSRAGSKRLKDIFTVLTYMILIVFVIGVQFFMQSLPKGQELASLETIIQTHGGLLKMMGQSFPPAIWVTQSLALVGTWDGFLNFLLFLALTIALFILMLFLGGKYFYRGLLAGEEVARKRRAKGNRKTLWRVSSPFRALMLREHRLFFRTPVFVINVLPVAVIIPVVMVLPLLAQGKISELAEIGSYMVRYPYLKLTIVAFMTFITGTLSLAPSAFSREGRLFFLSQLIPVRPGDQVKAKFWYIMAINFACALPSFALAVYIMRFTWLDTMMLAVLILTMTAVTTALGILIDLTHPYFDWDNPQRAMKNNLNVLFIMVATILLLAVLTAISVGLAFTVPWWMGYLTLLLLAGGAAGGLYTWQFALAEKKYREFEL